MPVLAGEEVLPLTPSSKVGNGLQEGWGDAGLYQRAMEYSSSLKSPSSAVSRLGLGDLSQGLGYGRVFERFSERLPLV